MLTPAHALMHVFISMHVVHRVHVLEHRFLYINLHTHICKHTQYKIKRYKKSFCVVNPYTTLSTLMYTLSTCKTRLKRLERPPLKRVHFLCPVLNKTNHHRAPQVFCGVLARVPIAATNWSVLELPDASFDALPKFRIVPRAPNQKL